MTTTIPPWEEKRTGETRRVEEHLGQYFERADAYRYNSASIRVRVIDSRFEGMPREKRDGLVEPYLAQLPEEIQRDIVTLFTFAPSELRETSTTYREFLLNTEFDDPSLEYRRLFSELLGTFMLVLVAAGGGILHARGQISLAAAVVAPGLMVMAILLLMGAVSGAHLNPVVSIAFALRRDFAWRRVPGYILVQLVGAALACLFLLAVLGNVKHLGATLPGPGYAPWQALLLEIALTATLVSVILGTASAAQNVGTLGALGVGGYIALAGLWAAPISGVSMNPARSFGPALISGHWADLWLYIAGPLAGAIIAVGCAYVLRGRAGHDEAARAAASGRLRSGAPPPSA